MNAASSTPAALPGLLLALADDDFILGYRDSEWTGIAPLLEEDVALSSMAQDEIGHARLLYEMASELNGRTPDQLALGRSPEEFRHCRLVERPRGDWAYTMARQFLYDAADAVRLDSLRRSSHVPLAQAVAKVIREEKYHRLHGDAWIDRLAQGSPESRRRLEAALQALWPDMAGFFEPVSGEEELRAAGTLPQAFAELLPMWHALVEPAMKRNRLTLPAATDEIFKNPAEPGGRQGHHSPEFHELWNEMTMVYRSDPEAVW